MNRFGQNFGVCLVVAAVLHAVLFLGLLIFFQKNTPKSDPIAALAPSPELVELQSAHWLETNVDQLSRQAEAQLAAVEKNEPKSEIPIPDTKSEDVPEPEKPQKVEPTLKPEPEPEPEPRKDLALNRLKPVPKPEPKVEPKPVPKPKPVLTPIPKPAPKPTPKPQAVEPIKLKPAPKPVPTPKSAEVAKPVVVKPTPLVPVPTPGAAQTADSKPGTTGAAGMGTAGGAGQNLNDYHLTVQSAFRSNWSQPRSILTAGKKYRVKTQIAIARDGRILNAQIVQGSEHPQMNESVASALAAVKIVPPLPSSIRGDRYDIYLNFDL